MSIPLNAKWLWSSSETASNPHQYVFFRKEFEVNKEETKKFQFSISTDTDFIAYINGIEFGRGQFSDYPEDKTYSVLELPELKTGKNIITVLVYYCGEDFQTYTPGQAGIIACIKSEKQEIITDSSWLCTAHKNFKSGMMPKLTVQLGFTTLYDAGNDIDYFSAPPAPDIWENAVELSSAIDGFHKNLKPRPIPLLKLGKNIPAQIVKQGTFEREKEFETFAETVSKDKIHFTTYDKVFDKNPAVNILDCDSDHGLKIKNTGNTILIADIGKESVGFITLKCKCSAGTVFDISHGEHLDDGQVRCKINLRNFTDRYIAKDGLNYYQLPFRRIGGRYIQLNITNAASDVEIIYIGIAPWNLPLPEESKFDCPDTGILKLRQVAIDTMELCMHDHYEDCPWREQALYAYDSRNQILYGYYAWGNYDYAKASIDLLGRGIRSDGFLNLCAPMKGEMTIPIFSFVWVSEILEHFLYSGDNELFELFDNQIESMINCRLKNYNKAKGLYHPGAEKHLWSFYEWVDGLYDMGCNENDFNALYNMYLCEMIEAYRQLLIYNNADSRAEKYTSLISNLKAAILKNFWNEEKGCFASKQIDGKQQMYHEHTQFLALSLDMADLDQGKRILDNLYSDKLIAATLSSMPYMIKGMLKHGERGKKFIQLRIARAYMPMLAVGATSLWETPAGSQDFALAGSLCHAWSSLPVYYDHAIILGVTPLTPGFKSFQVSPWTDELTEASGSIPTPKGEINISWQLKNGLVDIEINHPSGLEPTVKPYPESPLGNIKITSY
jgi:hypothetical protein